MMAGSYEDEQEYMETLVQKMLSDEEDMDPFADADSSDEWDPDEEASSPDEESNPTTPKRRKVMKKAGNDTATLPNSPVASTSRIAEHEVVSDEDFDEDTEVPARFSNLDRVIDEVVASAVMEDSSDDDTNTNLNVTWGQVDSGKLQSFNFTEANAGVNMDVINVIHPTSPYDFYKLMITDELVTHLVDRTNIYAEQCINATTHSRCARIQKWKATTPSEMEKFIGVIFWMGLCKFPQIRDHWTRRPLYKNGISKVISRNRFELLMRMWHLNDNEAPTTGRLHKIEPLIQQLKERFQLLVTPSEEVCIDETLVPSRGRLIFRQYIQNKRHKFGIKLFKLCLSRGYTYDLKVYCGKEASESGSSSVPTQVVMKLMENCLNEGRTLCTDNYYTSVALAKELLAKKTHLVGTLRKNRKNNPKEVVDAKLKTGQQISRQSNTGCVVTKWKDKRDVLMLSTKHDNSTVTVTRRGVEVEKPQAVMYYNTLKGFIDLSDQLKAYAPCLRKGVKWYRKLAVELITGMAVVNASILYEDVTKGKMSITRFKEEIAVRLLQLDETSTPEIPPDIASNHLLQKTNKKSRCISCYQTLSHEEGRVVAQKKATQTHYKCSVCNSYMCIDCFFKEHISTRK